VVLSRNSQKMFPRLFLVLLEYHLFLVPPGGLSCKYLHADYTYTSSPLTRKCGKCIDDLPVLPLSHAYPFREYAKPVGRWWYEKLGILGGIGLGPLLDVTIGGNQHTRCNCGIPWT